MKNRKIQFVGTWALAVFLMGGVASPLRADDKKLDAAFRKASKAIKKLEADYTDEVCQSCVQDMKNEPKSGAARFSDLLGRIKKALTNIDPNDQGALDRLRADLYLLQAELRLFMNYTSAGVGKDQYTNYAGEMSGMNAQVKQLEDSIGGYLETLRLGNNGNAALDRIKESLKNDGWLTSADGSNAKVDGIQKSLEAMKWQDAKTERNMLLDRVAQQLEYVQNTHYDMNEVEEGIHALRKEMRWYRYYVSALTTLDAEGNSVALLATTDDHCPSQGRAPAADAFKTGYTCKVSACLVQDYRSLESEMTGLKKRGADAMNAGKKAGDEITKRADEIMKSLHAKKIPQLLANQVRACKL
ncbi:MAG: hypothetical protein JNL01_06785 [Bdellovibrionales bacterium]|nr:hypothetical protein [Bdellovibrionales bacterium]